MTEPGRAPWSARGAAFRAAVLLALWAGFYVLGLSLALALLWVPWAQISYGSGPDLGGGLAALGALWVLWGLRPRFRRERERDKPLPADRHPKLHALVADVARRAGHPVPQELYLLPQANAYAGQRGVFLRRGEAMVGIGLPYLAWLDRPGVEAIIAHELGHHLSGDVRLGPWVHRTRSSMAHALEHLEGSGFWLDLPFVGYARAFLRYSSRVSRAQEVAADAVSAKVAGRDAAARALVAADARASAWQVYLFSEVVPMLEAGFLPDLLGGFRHFEAAVQDNRDRLKASRKPQKSSQYDTHPSLEERLAALGVEQAPSSSPSGALDLLDVASDAEEYVLRNLLVDAARPLARLAWQDAGRDLWLPRFRERIKPHQSTLAKVVPEAIPAVLERIDEWADRLRTGLALFSPVAKRRHVVALLGTWYAVYLADLGFELEALPGWPVRAVSKRCVVEPFVLVSALSERKLDALSWLAQCASVRAALE